MSIDRTRNPKDRREMAASLREIRAHYRSKGNPRYGRLFCKAVLGNFYTGLATSAGPERQL